jgi:antibiotic biosynthesis monooxygenase (ABM) superfamily enzyme
MVLHVVRYDIHPDKVDAYYEWAPGAIKRVMAVPGLAEFRAYRPASGAYQVVTTFEFTDFATWAAWYTHEEVQALIAERRALVLNEVNDIWGPSPVVPQPLRPGG